MAGSGSLLRVEEGHGSSSEGSSLLSASLDAAPAPRPLLGGGLARRLGAAGLAVLAAMLAVASASALLARSTRRAPVHVDSRGMEQKYYDGKGAYWQAPGRGISTSEVWGSCEHPHMHGCSGYCCCDKGFYWTSPKTIYKQGKAIVERAAVEAAMEESHGLSVASAAEEVAKKAAVSLGVAAAASVLSKDQRCVPQATVPKDVEVALDESGGIPGSDEWMACGAFTSNTHICGGRCCCNGGFRWSAADKACAKKRY